MRSLRLGLVSDIHGNVTALEAVLADGAAAGVVHVERRIVAVIPQQQCRYFDGRHGSPPMNENAFAFGAVVVGFDDFRRQPPARVRSSEIVADG